MLHGHRAEWKVEGGRAEQKSGERKSRQVGRQEVAGEGKTRLGT